MDRAALVKVCPNIALYYDGLVQAAERYNINTPLRQAHWLGQVGHESGEFGTITENLNYSAAGLGKIFPRYFPTAALQAEYARQPKRIANRAYANRLGNGSEASGDGWNYRGGGLIQLTGRYNYKRYSQLVIGNDSLYNNPEIIRNKSDPNSRRIAALVAGAFWSQNGLNSLADADSYKGITKKINGGYNGLAHRIDLTNRFKLALGAGGANITEEGIIDNAKVNPQMLEGTDNPSVNPEILNGNPATGSVTDYAPPEAQLSRPSIALIAPWPNRRPDHEPWARQLLVDATVNEETLDYLKNVNQNPQFEDDGTKEHSGKIGRVEGNETIERNPFWRR